jgi:hypothetical protein
MGGRSGWCGGGWVSGWIRGRKREVFDRDSRGSDFASLAAGEAGRTELAFAAGEPLREKYKEKGKREGLRSVGVRSSKI